MTFSLYRDPWFTFRFGDDRLIDRFHLDGIDQGRRVSVFRLDLPIGERGDLLRRATVGEQGWVELSEPIVVRAGEGFVVVVHDRDGA